MSALGLLLVSFVLAAFVIRHREPVDHLIRTIGPAAYPLAIALFALVASAPFSVTDFLAVMNGSIFGPFWGSVVNAIGLVCAAFLGYAINRRASHLLDLDSALERVPAWVKRFRVGSPSFLIAVRILPGIGGTLATSVAAAFRVPVWIHVVTMCAVAVPICTLLAVFGDRMTLWIHETEQHARAYYEHHHFRFHRRPPHPTSSP